MNTELEVYIDNFVNKFKIMTYNVDQAVREEKYENTRWMNRKSRVVSLIKEVDADIVCLQEMRQLPDSVTPNQFLAEFDQYFYEIGYRNSSTLAFGQAILYKPTKFYPMQIVKKWLSETPDKVSDTFAKKAGGTTGFGYIVLGVQFVPTTNNRIIQNAKPFWVFNTHFGLEEELKTKSCFVLKDIIAETSFGQEFVLCGDFNLFPDRDGAKQRDILCNWKYTMQDLGKGAKTLSGRQVEGTFVGYEHDEFKADLGNMVSRLDHVFSSTGIVGTEPTLYTKTMLDQEPEELATRKYPSDHLPLVISLVG